MFLLFFLCATCSLFSSEVSVVPYDQIFMPEHLYRYEANKKPLHDFAGWFYLDFELQKKGHHLLPTDLQRKNIPHPQNSIIFYDAPCWVPDWQKKISSFTKKKLLLIAYEPPSVRPWLYSKETLSHFAKVLTWNDDLVDNKKYFKFFHPVLLPMRSDILPFSQKKLLTQISTNRSSQHPHELYSERMKAIEFFEKKGGKDFCFYGRGWEKFGFKSYKGPIDNKYEVLKQYRFSLCYENIKNQPGYITEKIFDCFASGCVPIYFGAPNIAKFIPKNCFISRRDFKNYEELYSYLKNMKEDEYNKYIENIRCFLQSEKAKYFSPEFFAETVLQCLEI